MGEMKSYFKAFWMRGMLTALIITAVFSLSSSDIVAQVLQGTIVGTVKDESGAVIPGADITVTNTQTNRTVSLVANDAGAYTARSLQPGIYSVTIMTAGFKQHVETSVQVTPGVVTRVDATLAVGAVTESVTVTGRAGLLQTDQSDVHSELVSEEITALPTNLYRNYQSLMDLVPGAAPTRFQNATMDLPQRSLTTNVSGQARNSNNTKLDGVNNMMAYYPHQTLYIPPQESVATVNVTTNTFDAEEGMAGGSAIRVQTKSGTNEFHGAAFGYLDNSALSAKNYFTPEGQGIPKNIVTMYGGTIGGPIIKDKLFFFFGYEGMRERRSYDGRYTIPTMAMRTGDFSDTGTAIFDPLTGNLDGSGREAFTNSIIPADRINSVAKQYLQMLPEPNLPGFTNNYYSSAPFVFDRDNFDIKIDWMVSEGLNMWGKHSLMDAAVTAKGALGEVGGPALSDGGTGTGNTRIQLAAIGWTNVFTPTFLMDGSIGWNRYANSTLPDDYGTNWGLDFFKIPGTNGPDDRYSGMPTQAISGYTTYGTVDNWMPCDRRDNTYVGSFNFSWIAGSHDFRFGTDMDWRGINHWQAGTGGYSQRGGFAYSGGVTALKGGSSPNRYNAMADFMLGMPIEAGKQHVEHATIRESTFGVYFRDRWQVTDKLTLNLGLRWEYYTLPRRDHRGVEWYDITDDLVYVGGVANIPENYNVKASKNGFGPRLGLAYRFDDETVLRSGFGITIDPFSIGRAMRSPYPINIAFDVEGPNSYQPYASSIQAGLPVFEVPDISSGIIILPPAVRTTFVSEGVFRRGYIESWNLILERQLPFSLVGSVGYVAARGIRQRVTMERNVEEIGGGSKSRPLNILFGRSGSIREHLPWQSTDYHSLQATLDRRFRDGLYIKSSYTWAKAIGYNDDSNSSPAIPHPDYWYLNRGVQGHNRSHVLRTAFIYDLPFGPNRNWVQEGVMGAILGNWQVNGIVSFYTGTPFSVTASNASLNASRNAQRADQVKAEVEKLGGIGAGNPFYDTSAFAPVTEVRFGTTGRNSLVGPGVANLDAGIFRKFNLLSERIELQFRAEAFNLTNTPHFRNPSGNASNAGTFMTVTSAAGDQRHFRFGVRLSF